MQILSAKKRLIGIVLAICMLFSLMPAVAIHSAAALQAPTCVAGSCPSGHFTDAPDTDNWAHSGIDYMLQLGLISGATETTFQPDAAMTRAQFVQVLYCCAGQPAVSGRSSFRDVADGRAYSKAVAWAQKIGVILGTGDGRFLPEHKITREQMVTMLYRYAIYSGLDVSVGEDTNVLSYPDAEDTTVYAIPAMQWACGVGLISGAVVNGELLLLPTDHATRAQVCAVLARYAQDVAG